jgi:hypothetical protein
VPAAAQFRDVIGRFPTGVAIITCQGPDGPAGLTTNAITSLSLDPLLMLVCFDNGSRTLEAVRAERRFAINVLRAGSEDLARVFERFVRASSPETRGIRGAGLGLYIVKNLVELLGGRVSVESTPGEGSTFAFTLPVAKLEPATVPKTVPIAPLVDRADEAAAAPALPDI